MEPTSVLVVDDDTSLCDILAEVLRENAFNVRVARNGAEALEHLREHRPDVALVDVRMPRLSGIELLTILRAEGIDSAVILMTAHADVQSAALAVQNRAYSYLQKPFDLDALLSTVQNAAAMRRLERDNRRMFADLKAGEERLRRSVADAQSRAAELDALYTLARAASGSLSRPEVVDGILIAVADVLRVEAELDLFDEPSGRLSSIGRIARAGLSLPANDGAVAAGAAESAVRGVDPVFVTSVEGARWPTAAALPLVTKGRAIGVLSVGRNEPWSETERRLLPNLAAVAAMSLENALLFERANEAVETLRRGQQRMLENERLAVVGQLAAGVAHEINNPCAVLLANLHLLRLNVAAMDGELTPEERARLREESRALIDDSVTSGERIRNIVRNLRTFGRSARDAAQPTDVNQLLDSTLALLRGELASRTRIVRNFTKLPPVDAQPGRLGQVFLHLLMNAAQALPEEAPDRNEIEVSTCIEADRWVVVRIRDTGVGISSELLPRIFEPYFTTKPVGQGSGLGLSIALDIVRHHGGELRLSSGPGRGTVAEIRLPFAPRLVEASRPASRTSRRVLLVDDEPRVLTAFARLVGQEHDVVTAASGQAALSILEHDAAFDLVLCDLGMPEPDGIDLYEAIRSRWPELVGRFAVVTGGASNERTRTFLERERPRVLEKPFSHEELKRMLESVPARATA